MPPKALIIVALDHALFWIVILSRGAGTILRGVLTPKSNLPGSLSLSMNLQQSELDCSSDCPGWP